MKDTEETKSRAAILWKKGHRQPAVLLLLAAAPSGIMTATELYNRLPADTPKELGKVLNTMQSNGLVTVVGLTGYVSALCSCFDPPITCPYCEG